MCIHVYVCYGRVCDVGKQQRESERNSVESENHPISLLPSRLYWVVEGAVAVQGAGVERSDPPAHSVEPAISPQLR